MAKVLSFLQGLAFGGDDTILIETVRAWPEPRDRHAVVLNASHPGLPAYRRALGGRAEIIPLKTPSIVEDKSRLGPAAQLLRPWRAAACRRAFRDIFERLDPDAVLIHSGGFPLSDLSWRMLRAAAGYRRCVVAVHGYPELGVRGLRSLVLRRYGRSAARLADRLVTVSSGLAGMLRSLTGRQDILVVPNGLGPRERDESSESKRSSLGLGPDPGPLIGAVCNLEEHKGLIFLVRALPALMAASPELHLVLIGPPSEPQYAKLLQAEALRLGIGDRVLMPGYLPDAGRYCECFDVCVLPSIGFESFGLLALEAMRYGRPAVGTRVGGIPEVIEDGVTGLLVAPGDAAALAAAVGRLLKDRALSSRLGAAGRRRFEMRFTAERMATAYRAACLG